MPMDWDGLLRLGLHGLRLQPAQFWALTPIELLVMSGSQAREVPLSRTGLEALAAQFPDETKGASM